MSKTTLEEAIRAAYEAQGIPTSKDLQYAAKSVVDDYTLATEIHFLLLLCRLANEGREVAVQEVLLRRVSRVYQFSWGDRYGALFSPRVFGRMRHNAQFLLGIPETAPLEKLLDIEAGSVGYLAGVTTKRALAELLGG